MQCNAGNLFESSSLLLALKVHLLNGWGIRRASPTPKGSSLDDLTDGSRSPGMKISIEPWSAQETCQSPSIVPFYLDMPSLRIFVQDRKARELGEELRAARTEVATDSMSYGAGEEGSSTANSYKEQ